LSSFSSISVLGRSVSISSNNPKRTRTSTILATAFAATALIIAVYPNIDDVNRGIIFPLFVAGYAISSRFVGKAKFPKNREDRKNSDYIGNLYLFNLVLLVIIIIFFIAKFI